MCFAIQNILTLAKQTFARKIAVDGSNHRLLDNEEFMASLKEISEVIKQIHINDLGLDQSPALFPDKRHDHSYKESKPNTEEQKTFSEEYNEVDINISGLKLVPHTKAPVTYISVHEDRDFSISIFIVDAHARIPLHNHPEMHGLLQVVHGTLAISCYNRIPLSDLSPDVLPEVLKNKQHLLQKGYIVPAENVMNREPKDNTSGPLIVQPDKDNYHEIWNTGDKPAAILDILAPPYTHEEPDQSDEHIPDKERRHCDFYKIARPLQRGVSNLNNQNSNDLDNKTYWLQVIPTPSDYNCDFEPYMGPPLVPPS